MSLKERLDFQYYLSYDYSTETDCERYGCDMICRCGKITNLRVTDSPIIDVVGCLVVLLPKGSSKKVKPELSIDIYCLDRIAVIFELYEPTAFDIQVQPGYYGEEVGKATVIDNRFYDALEKFFTLKSDAEKIEFILELEYINVLPELLNRNWEIKTIKKADLILGASNHAGMVKRKDVSFYENRELPCGVAILQGGKYRLIDGYHRVAAHQGDKILMVTSD